MMCVCTLKDNTTVARCLPLELSLTVFSAVSNACYLQ